MVAQAGALQKSASPEGFPAAGGEWALLGRAGRGQG